MRIGITGHRQLEDPAAWSWVEEIFAHELDRAERPLLGVTSLAIGADQLFARQVLRAGGAIHAVLPFADIERSFSPEELPAYRALLAHASVEVLRTHGTDEDAYLAAGQRVVDLSDLMLAVWDGQPARGTGGTADIVAYALGRGIPVDHFDPLERKLRRLRPDARTGG